MVVASSFAFGSHLDLREHVTQKEPRVFFPTSSVSENPEIRSTTGIILVVQHSGETAFG